MNAQKQTPENPNEQTEDQKLETCRLLIEQSHIVRQAGFVIEVSYRYNWVSIYQQGNRDKDVFLQGTDAHHFIKELNVTHERLQFISKTDLALALSQPYIDSLL